MTKLEAIVANRRREIETIGYSQGAQIPARREVPVVPFASHPALICEIKRRSPSRGELAPKIDAVEQAGVYRSLGAGHLSVLTERDYFGGSLDDLMAIKRAYPDLALLRKDFLLEPEDIRVSWRAGADAALLIASILSPDRLEAMAQEAESLGMQALVETHSVEEIAMARRFRPSLVGINCRDLQTFNVDPLLPIALRERVDWGARVIFESGISMPEHIWLARENQFDGALVGEAVMRDPQAIAGLLAAFDRDSGSRRLGFWRFVARQARRPLVKICGITHRADALLASKAGADMLGFVFAPSPRQVRASLLEELRDLPTPKIAVVTADREVDRSVRSLLRDGLIDAIQFHGNESPDQCAAMAFPYYKAIRVKDTGDLDRVGDYHCPRVLLDAYHPRLSGGTGKKIDDDLIDRACRSFPLWIAGGISPDNIAEMATKFRPELVDLSSRIENSEGRKDRDKIARFFEELNRVRT